MLIRRGVCRLGVMLAGLGSGLAIAAMASTPATAWADAFDFDPNNFAVSIDGVDLTKEGTATASSTLGNIAIADGADSHAITSGGILDWASALGSGSDATAGDSGSIDLASAYGDGSMATSTIGDINAAFANGAGSNAFAGGYQDTTGSVELAAANGTHANAAAVEGLFNQAFVTGDYSSGASGVGNGDFASVLGNYDIAGANGYESQPGEILLGNNDIALVIGSESYALAGANFTDPGSFDLAAIFGDSLTAYAQGANFLADIVPSLF